MKTKYHRSASQSIVYFDTRTTQILALLHSIHQHLIHHFLKLLHINQPAVLSIHGIKPSKPLKFRSCLTITIHQELVILLLTQTPIVAKIIQPHTIKYAQQMRLLIVLHNRLHLIIMRIQLIDKLQHTVMTLMRSINALLLTNLRQLPSELPVLFHGVFQRVSIALQRIHTAIDIVHVILQHFAHRVEPIYVFLILIVLPRQIRQHVVKHAPSEHTIHSHDSAEHTEAGENAHAEHLRYLVDAQQAGGDDREDGHHQIEGHHTVLRPARDALVHYVVDVGLSHRGAPRCFGGFDRREARGVMRICCRHQGR
mmetsp:Transcript_58176/g.92429  ORF Transcript_58176/g.92429 Transcript_58176/m.92429 type:complete len:311 (+) Transcript_58176:140-1072(+)